ncbi:lipase family protein (macronuclear) [Tetrahymena thermophila SB210]|uniref:Lipase family protein n=1 Tax=Tetrahymena thermophila (strain SB210) TaxID=312017 RepID=Q230U4_TETTS|nr:lipase family protein [Tetrahymena thermophila SB210]EAR91195.2 lipase family protein [Tetrahymena thermophila SB210]|eukprot:XP_001011440.2 lipase family protein [Tetrahymena thermophila SB210]
MKTNQIIFLLLSTISLSVSSFQYDIEVAERLSAYSLASYCSHSNLKNWSCGKTCERVEPLKDIKTFENEKEIFYMIGYSKKEDAIVIATRGTLPWSIQNWLTDLSISKVDYQNCKKCQVHQGFYEAFQSIFDSLKIQFIKMRKQYQYSKIYITGHSLGGALATLLVPEIYKLNNNMPVDAFITQGSPRIGNQQFSLWFAQNNNFSKISARITLNKDPVVQLPAYSFPFSFKHIGNEVFYSDASTKHQYTKCLKPEDQSCSFGVYFATNVIDHQSYFGFGWGLELLSCR